MTRIRRAAMGLVGLLCMSGFAGPAVAETAASQDVVVRPTVGFAVGPALMLKSKSRALGQFLQPVASVFVTVPWRSRFTVGGEVVALLDTNEHYRVIGALASGGYSFLQRPRFGMDAQLGLGLGNDADILNTDLRGGSVAIYATAGFKAHWSVGDAWLLGVNLDTLNLATARLAPFVARRF